MSAVLGRPTADGAVLHPWWWSPVLCWVYPVCGGGIEVFHRFVALGDPWHAAGPCIEITEYVATLVTHLSAGPRSAN